MASTIIDYSTLLQACIEASEDYSAEFASYFPAALGNAEMRLFREFDIVGKIRHASPTVTTSTPFVTKPNNFRVARSVFYVNPTTGARKLLRRKTRDFINVYWPNPNLTSEPKYYDEYDETSFQVAPTPASNTTLFVEYEALPDRLSPSSPTNSFTKFMPDVLFNATMVELMKYARNDTLLAAFEATYQDVKRYTGVEILRTLKDDGVVFGNPQGQSLQQMGAI